MISPAIDSLLFCSSFLGKVFLLTEFQAKLFLTQNWPGGIKRDRLLSFIETFIYRLVLWSLTEREEKRKEKNEMEKQV